MFAAKKTIDKRILQELVPLNALSADRFRVVADKIVVEEVRSGRYLFRKGDRDNQSIYLLEGKVNLIDDGHKSTTEIAAGTDGSRHPIANQQPRPLSARAGKKVVIARIDTSLLEAFLNWDQGNSPEAVEITADDDSDWMTRMLQSGFFARIPPAMIQRLLMKLEPFPLNAGEIVINQGDEGEYFYTISKGRCVVTHRMTLEEDSVVLAELAEGDCFGEEALVAGTPRNASVTMLTDGLLMRLPKVDFIELLQNPLVRYINHEEAVRMVDDGAVWLDVRPPDEYEASALEDSVNIPLADLRGEMPELVFNAKYVVCCDNEGDANLAAFILSHRGFDIYVLSGGLASLSAGDRQQAGLEERPPQPDATADGGAEIIDFGRGKLTAAVIAPAAEAEADGAAAGGQAAELAQHLEALQEENRSLSADACKFREEEAVLHEQLELARAELGESGEKLEELFARAKSDADEKQLLREQYTALQQEHEERITKLDNELELAQQQLIGLQSEVEAARHEQQSLQDQALDRDSQQERAERLAEELAGSREQLEGLQAEVAHAEEAAARLQQTAEAERGEQQVLIAQLREELDESRKQLAQLRESLDAVGTDRQAAEQAVQGEVEKQRLRADGLAEEHSALQGQYRKLAEELDGERQRADRLQENNGGLEAQLDNLRGELEAGQREIRELAQTHEQDRQRLAEISGEHESAAQAAQALQRELEQLRDGQRQLEDRLQEQTDRAEGLSGDKQSVEQALAEQQAVLHAAEQTIEELREQHGQLQQHSTDEVAQLEEALRKQAVEAEERLEAEKARIAGLDGEKSVLASELELLGAERDGLQQRLETACGNEQRLQQDIDALNQQIAAQTDAGDECLRALQEQVETQRQQLAGMAQDNSEKDSQLEELQARLDRNEQSGQVLEEELDRLRERYEEAQRELEQQTERNSLLEAEIRDRFNQAQDDQPRENSTEKELTGQLERLRKKLEQSAADLQAVRADARNDLNNIRDELHAERQARTGERAEMAARQRELKDQLAAIAREHEENLARQSVIIAQEREAAREEERARLQDELTGQGEYEKRIAALQEELEQTRSEITAFERQAAAQHEDSWPSEEAQNRQSADVIAALEARVRELSDERDAALDERNGMQERLDTLREEAEAVHGFMGADGGGQRTEDPVQLRIQLDAARKEIETAEQLRTEAETARDRIAGERDSLRVQIDNRLTLGEPLNLVLPGVGADGVNPAAAGASPAAEHSGVIAERPAGDAPGTGTASFLRSGRMLGLGIVLAMIACAGWLLFENGTRLPGFVDFRPGGRTDGGAVGVPPSVSGDLPPVAAVQPEPVVEQQASQLEAEERPLPAASVDTPPAVTSGRVFRDSLGIGGQGPLLVELPAASYRMGSVGNSLNFDEGPQHAVNLAGFAIGKYEVTFAEYDRFARATGRRLPADENWGRGKRPVINVSWTDASAYADWLTDQTGHTYRLPTEAEWEFAARAGTSTPHWWDTDSDAVFANCFNCGSEWDARQTAPVGSFEANNFGLYDTAGNVQEWVGDCYHNSYETAPVDGSAWLKTFCTQRVVRGGAYSSPLDSLRSAKRAKNDQENRLDNIGFRVVRVN